MLRVLPMSKAIVRTPRPNPLVLSGVVDTRRVIEAFFKARNQHTVDAYRRDLEDFTYFMGESNSEEAARKFFALQPGAANATVLEYRGYLVEKGLSPATVNRRLSAVRSLTKLAKLLGIVQWTIEVDGVDSVAYRNTAGPGLENVRQLFEFIATNSERKGPNSERKGLRDLAICHLLFDIALRRGEIVSLNMEHLLQNGISVLGKKRTQRETIALPDETRAVLNNWLAVRGSALPTDPMFIALDRHAEGSRLTGRGVHQVVARWGKEADLEGLHPHGFRHTAITTALDNCDGDIRKVQSFSRHADPRTLMRYDDKRKDFAGEIARGVVASLAKQ